MESINIEIKGKTYKVQFPNVRQLREIEQTKMHLTDNKYVDFSLSVLKTHVYLLDLVDTIAYFSVLVPELKEDLGIKDWYSAEQDKLRELVIEYKNTFLPWYKKTMEDLYNYDKK